MYYYSFTLLTYIFFFQVVIEKRDRFSRNNVLHLWPFVIEDLRMLGAKKFFGKFCAGSIDHISIRQLQCILLKVALLLGVEVHTEVSFEKLIEPSATESKYIFLLLCFPISYFIHICSAIQKFPPSYPNES